MKFMNEVIDWPLDTNIIRRNSESHTFGMVRRNLDGSSRAHQGWDFYAKSGTRCYSVSRGEVKFAGVRGALGNLVVINIGNTPYFTAYAHLSSINVSVGDIVKVGQFIGLTGNTGNASSMAGVDEHLHFEVREEVITGIGLDKRISPIKLFGTCPLQSPQFREFE
jgi:murein DD-endopeptidase MepM/ murein hydrolase activator NlpD